MSVRKAVDTTSKAFATGGEDFAYYLSESRAMQGLTVIPTETPDWLTHHNGFPALALPHADCRWHGEAARDFFCGRRRQGA
jgi:hypothetical protein